jgi:hypothetical protein
MNKYDKITKKILYIEYVINKQSTITLAKKYRCSQCCIYKKMIKYHIKRRKSYEHFIGIKRPEQSLRLKKYNPFKGKHHTEKTKKYLSLIHRDKHSFLKTEFKKGHKLSIKTKRKLSLIRGGTGIPYEDKEYSIEFYNKRKSIKQRDNYKCQLCGKKGTDIHHINYDTFDNNNKNLITLCRNCHCRTINNRDYWFAYFRYITINFIKDLK